ncbi:photosystem reaction center subunit H [Kosmotoga arenicorallina S304]|uniref:Photosystem reaction center subunit H n=1 Tax=Kosmotoga arenicorallina S304 TaxID=1453497 RepID=A0A176JUS3_9BACT|nr:PRC-barrel domain-containing protein [Kosmotoga arenicorallina]OAA27197.1 photosystem reaction center subunit H [Kosmotoga arenicorallina S304]
MENKLKWGARVLSEDGKNLGRLTRVVFHPSTNEVTHIVVEKGVFNRRAKLVPINSIQFAASDEVRLKIDAAQIDELQDFEETYFLSGENIEGEVKPLYWLRPIGDYPEIYPLPPLAVSYNLDENSHAIEPGVTVISAEDHEVGRVKSVLLDEKGHITHFVAELKVEGKISTKIIPIDWVSKIEDSFLKVSASESMLAKLPDKS